MHSILSDLPFHPISQKINIKPISNLEIKNSLKHVAKISCHNKSNDTVNSKKLHKIRRINALSIDYIYYIEI